MDGDPGSGRDWLLDAGFGEVVGYGAEGEPLALGSRMILVASPVSESPWTVGKLNTCRPTPVSWSWPALPYVSTVVVSPGWPWSAVQEAAQVVGVDPSGAYLLAHGHRATVALPRAGLVVRAGRTPDDARTLAAELEFARLAASYGVPVVAPADGVAVRPVGTRAGPVTFWPLLRLLSRELANWRWLGSALAALHRVPLPSRPPGGWNPVGLIMARVVAYAQANDADPAVAAAFRVAVEQVQIELNGLEVPRVLIHGDATPGNVVVTARGSLLVDFDLAGVGPAAWDVTGVVVWHRRFNKPAADLERLVDAYGADLRESPNFVVLYRLREILDASFALQHWRSNERELRVRLRAVNDPVDDSTWRGLTGLQPAR
jgi:Ser/Thr protein kinase RdoA (MazF antagonist)